MKLFRPLKIKLIIAASTIIFSNPVLADLSPRAFNELINGDKTSQAMLEMYVGGVIKGYLHANAYLAEDKQKQIFCFNGDMTTGDALRFSKHAINEFMEKRPEDADEGVVEMLILFGLKSMYPC